MSDFTGRTQAAKEALTSLKEAISDLQLTVLDLDQDPDHDEHTAGILDGFTLVNELIDVIIDGLNKGTPDA